MAMAIVTSRHIAGDVRLAQCHCLAMIGITVVQQALAVALAATGVAGLLEVDIRWRFNVVRGMAIGADRAERVALGEQLAVDALVINFLDPEMARSAGFGDVVFVDRRTAVDAALDVMHPVAIIA